jgi:transcription initiation factor TFIIIB Brf1 subunit/transcription initiation factor TFIIB
MKQIACPSCESTDIDSERGECRTCGIGLPEGSFDSNVPPSRFRASHHATNVQKFHDNQRAWDRRLQ